jgi:hypothetical protein
MGEVAGTVTAKSALNLIDHEAHIADLTQKVHDLLSESSKGKKE